MAFVKRCRSTFVHVCIRTNASERCRSDLPVQLIQDGRCEITRDAGAASVGDVFPHERRRVVVASSTKVMYQSQLPMVSLVFLGLVQSLLQVRFCYHTYEGLTGYKLITIS